MISLSILFEQSDKQGRQLTTEAPDFFRDLNLDQIVKAMVSSCKDYDLAPLFFSSLKGLNSITYRQDVMKDLENESLQEVVAAFSELIGNLRNVRPPIQNEDQSFKYQEHGMFLSAVRYYCRAVRNFAKELAAISLKSKGMLAFREYLQQYAASDSFSSLEARTASLAEELNSIRYGLLINGRNVTVNSIDVDPDYLASVERTFQKFREGEVKDYRKNLQLSGLNHVQSLILQRVAKLHPKTFQALEEYSNAHSGYMNETISRFADEVQFYLVYLKFIADVKRSGLRFCYPQLSRSSKELSSSDSFDLALANELLKRGQTAVTNDFYLSGSERILVVSGPNQGGKTTFARCFGQLHYLATLGFPVPGTEARLHLFDQMFTHFQRQENINNAKGLLYDELVRIRKILDQATANSIIVMNESFASTTLYDASFLGQIVVERLSELDALGVCVTFLDQLASLNNKTVSFVSKIDAGNPSLRSFKIERREADGLAFAQALAAKHRVTYASLKERLNK